MHEYMELEWLVLCYKYHLRGDFSGMILKLEARPECDFHF